MGRTIKLNKDIGTTKLIDIGNSKGLVLSKLLLAIADWHKGDLLSSRYIASGNSVVITNITKTMKELEKARIIEKTV